MLNLPIFCACPKKKEARFKTIIEQYRSIFQEKIPKEKQYWTMCSYHVTKDGEFSNNSELGQMLSNDLIEENQFRGVDIEEEIIISNKIARPTARWIHSDFLNAMKDAFQNKEFNPAIVNADLLHLKERGAKDISRIMAFLTDCKVSDVLLIANVMLSNPHSKHMILGEQIEKSADDFIKELFKSRSFKHSWGSGEWSKIPQHYIYNGTGAKSRTMLASYLFVKKS